MSVSFSDHSELFIDLYKSGGKIAPYIQMLDCSARQMLEKTNIFSSLSRAKALHHIYHSTPFGSNPSQEEIEMSFEIIHLLSECLSPLVDDVLLLSAFEIKAKTELLRKRYVVHDVLAPKEIADRQRKHPIHILTIQALQKTSNPIIFKDTTLGLATLLKPNYKKFYPMLTPAEAGLDEVRKRRNLVHFNMGVGWTITKEMLAFVDYLNGFIPPKKKRRNS